MPKTKHKHWPIWWSISAHRFFCCESIPFSVLVLVLTIANSKQSCLSFNSYFAPVKATGTLDKPKDNQKPNCQHGRCMVRFRPCIRFAFSSTKCLQMSAVCFTSYTFRLPWIGSESSVIISSSSWLKSDKENVAIITKLKQKTSHGHKI